VVDPITVAVAATPFLLKAVQALGDKIWDKTSDAAADEAAGFGHRLLARLLHRGEAPDPDPASDQATDPDAGVGSGVVAVAGTGGQAGVALAVRDLVATPDDQDLQVGLRVAVRRLLAADPVLMAEVADMVDRQAPAQQAGDRSIQVGGAQHGGVNVTGDGNDISYGGPGQA
jgi:hypothetical protein